MTRSLARRLRLSIVNFTTPVDVLREKLIEISSVAAVDGDLKLQVTEPRELGRAAPIASARSSRRLHLRCEMPRADRLPATGSCQALPERAQTLPRSGARPGARQPPCPRIDQGDPEGTLAGLHIRALRNADACLCSGSTKQ